MAKARKLMVGSLRARTAALAISAIAMASFAPTATAEPAKFWGVAPQVAPTLEQFQRLKRGGVDSVRISVVWPLVQTAENGPFNWADVDRQIENTSLAGLEVLPFLSGAPSWAVAVDRRFNSPRTLPVKTASQRFGWKNFVSQAVLRYGPNGSFWAEHPGVPPRPIRTWQIWNEQNFQYFVARPNPAEYGKLLKLSYATIKGIDPAAQIILGGMFAKPLQATYKRKPPLAYFASDFLERLYRTTPGVKAKFNGVALHPYTSSYRDLTPDIEEIRSVLKKNHDAGKGMWITEMGWSSRPPSAGNSFAKGRKGQATQLKGAFKLLASQQRRWRIKRVYWFSVDDLAGACNFCDGSGLFGTGFVPKPSWNAFVRFSGGVAG
jgi:hypothetical protein